MKTEFKKDDASQKSRPQTSQSGRQACPFATDDQPMQNRPQSSKSYSARSDNRPSPIPNDPNVLQEKDIGNMYNKQQGQQSQQELLKLDKLNIVNNVNLQSEVSREQILCKSPQSEISQANSEDVSKYSRRSRSRPMTEQLDIHADISPDPSPPPENFMRKNEATIEEMKPRPLNQLKEYIKDRLSSMDTRGFLALERAFVLADGSKTREIDITTFADCLAQCGIAVSSDERKVLYQYCNQDGKKLPY